MNQKPIKQIEPYNQKVPEACKNLFNKGNVYVRTKHAAHKEKVAIAIALPLILFGNISDKTTQVTGARDMA